MRTSLFPWLHGCSSSKRAGLSVAVMAIIHEKNHDVEAAPVTSRGRNHHVPCASAEGLVFIHQIGERHDYHRDRIG